MGIRNVNFLSFFAIASLFNFRILSKIRRKSLFQVLSFLKYLCSQQESTIKSLEIINKNIFIKQSVLPPLSP